MIEDCKTCQHLACCAARVRTGEPVVCEDNSPARQQTTHQVQAWISTSRPQHITSSLIVAQFGLRRKSAEYVLRTLARRNVIVVVERRPRRDVVYRVADESLGVPGPGIPGRRGREELFDEATLKFA